MDSVLSGEQKSVHEGAALEASARTSLQDRYVRVRRQTETLCEGLEIEDYGIQTMPDVSPPKWHLAHTAWFFETLILKPYLKGYQQYHPLFPQLFNSYYESLGDKHPRPERGLLSRPTVREIYAYRSYIDEAMLALLSQQSHPAYAQIYRLTLLGINHEQQHQELLLTDIKHIFAYNPLQPVYRASPLTPGKPQRIDWLYFDAGLYNMGRDESELDFCDDNFCDDFCYDNETPAHQVYLQGFRMRNLPVLNGEYLEFIEAGGYRNPELWLSDAWKCIREKGWDKPLYWMCQDRQWLQFSLTGVQPLDPYAPVCHVSFYEAAAYARWKSARLASEFEWELAAGQCTIQGNFVDSGSYHPQACAGDCDGLQQMFGDVWEWTQSAYSAYPGYTQSSGALGEYNGKFMSSQMVLRGGSCATAQDHIRSSYRNFFYPGDRWQFSGFRLVEDVK